MITLSLPFPPSVNHYWFAKGNRRFIGAKGVEFRRRTAEIVAETGKKIDGRLSLFICVFPPDRRRRDLDNMLKALCDALQHAGCYDDDEQIDELVIVRRSVVKGGSCKIVLCPISESPLSIFS